MKSKIIASLVMLGIIGTSIAVPFFGASVLLSGILMFVYNKVGFKNKKSKLFGVTHGNIIEQKIGMNLFYTSFIKDKSKFFKSEMINLFKDLQSGVTYETASQAIVLRSLKNLEKQGLITELVGEEMVSKSSFVNKLNHFIVNIGMGNYSNPLKTTKKYYISFRRSAKEMDDNFIDSYLNNKQYIDTSLKPNVSEKNSSEKRRDVVSSEYCELTNELNDEQGRSR